MGLKIFLSFYLAMKIYSSQHLTKLTGISIVIYCPCFLHSLQTRLTEAFIENIFAHSIAIQQSQNVQLLLYSTVILLFKPLDLFPAKVWTLPIPK